MYPAAAAPVGAAARSVKVQVQCDKMTASVQAPLDGQAGQGSGTAGTSYLSGQFTGRSFYAQGMVGSEACTLSLVGP